MAMNILNADDIKKALDAFKAPGSFSYKKFFEMLQQKKISAAELFAKLDSDQSRSIDKRELKSLLKVFDMNARELTDKEASDLIKAIDKDGSGTIEEQEFVNFARA